MKKNSLFNRVYGTVATMFLFIVATCSFSACSKDDETPPIVSPYVESRTVMVYMVAENSLNKNVWADVQEMLVGMNNDTLSANDRLVIYLDDVKLPRIYVVDKTTKITQFSELVPVMTYENDVNSSSAEQLGTFIDYVKSNYPAESYGLVMWSHASGWTPSNFSGDMYSETPTKRKSFGVDNGKNTTNNNGNQMNIDDMASVLQGNAFDFIFFDACVMQTIEVAYELRDAAKWLIASPAEIPASGANYETMTRAMFLKDDYVNQMLTVYKQELKVLDDEEYAQWKGNTDKLITCVHTGRWYSGYPKSTIAIDDAQCCGMAMFIPFEKYTYSYESFNEKYLKTSWAKAVWIE